MGGKRDAQDPGSEGTQSSHDQPQKHFPLTDPACKISELLWSPLGFLRGRSRQPKGGTHSSQQQLWAQLLPLPWDAKAFPGNERLQPLPAPASGRRKVRTAPVFLGLLHFQRRLRGAGPQEKPISSASGRDNISAKQSEISSGSCL